MRIEQIDLKAFGHFTGRRLRFDGASDLHIAYGPNEAGKSTLSRALRAALFGIPERTGDNHLHANPNLRIGLVLAATDGRRLALMRRKARKNSLLRYDPDSGEELGETVADEILSGWLGGLSEGLYSSMFGLDHDSLVAGGRELAEGKGELGQILFEAGAGLTSIRGLRERLAREADDLFRPRASTSSIYRALGEYAEARRSAKEHLTRPADWETLRKAAEQAEDAYLSARRAQDQRQSEALRLQRLAAVLPDVASRTLALQRLEALGEVVRLPPEATARRIAAQTRAAEADSDLDEAQNTLGQLRRDLEAIEVPEAILAQASAIESLHYGLDAFRAARDTATSASDRQQRAEKKVAEVLKAMGALGTGVPRALIPDAVLKASVRAQASEQLQRRGELQAAMAQTEQARQELDDLAEELAALGPRAVPPSLMQVLQTLDAEGNPEGKLDDLERQLSRLESTLTREAAQLSAVPLESLVALKPPAPGEVQAFRKRRKALEADRQSRLTQIEKIENDRASVNGELAGLLQQAEAPTADQLTQRRNERDGLWQKLRQRLFQEGPAPVPVSNLPTAGEYEAAVQLADSIADRRFADASRIAQHDALTTRLAQMQAGLDLERNRLEQTEAGLRQLERDWQALLVGQGLPVLDMDDLEDWLSRWKLIDQRFASVCEQREELAKLRLRTEAARGSLAAALTEAEQDPVGGQESLAQAIARARRYVTAAQGAVSKESVLARKQKAARKRLDSAQSKIEECTKQQEAWQLRWSTTMAALRLPEDAGTAEAEARLAQLDVLQEHLDLQEHAASEQSAAQALIDQTEAEVARIYAAIAYTHSGQPAESLIRDLWRKLEEARTLAASAASLQERLRETEKAVEKASQSKQHAEQELSALMAVAHCGSIDTLIEAEQRSSNLQAWETEVAEIEARLVKASALPLQAVLAQAEGQDQVEVRAALERQTQAIQEQAPEVEALHARLIQAQSDLRQVDGSAAAAAAEQQAADTAASLSHLVAQYSSARLASAILADVIETYQQRHQGPLLARASDFFATITGGRFIKVATDFDEERTILVGVRGNGRREQVGNLSTGTRDQLFLALRLAAIESHVTRQEPMPVAVDDIVINFDDAAAGATFQVLAELSKKTQVLFFTHHEHLLELATAAIGANAFTAHRL
jgi:uncharacterized protein YhaN